MSRGLLIVVGAFDERGGLQLRWRRIAEQHARERTVTILTWAPGWRVTARHEHGYCIVRVPAVVAWDRDRPLVIEAVNTVVSVVTGAVAAIVLRRRWHTAVGAGLHPEATVAGIAATALGRRFLAETWLVGPLGNVERLRRSPLRRPVTALLRRARRVMVATEQSEQEVVSLGIPLGLVVRQDNALDLDRFSPATPEQLEHGRALLGVTADHALVYAGRLDLRQKRLDLLIEAWAAADPTGWELVIVGSGTDADRVGDLVAQARSSIRTVGWVDDVAGALRGADAFAFPTRFESPGYALLEGMACGLPGLASAIDLYRSWEPHGVTLVDDTVTAWRDAIAELVGLPVTERRERGRSARGWLCDLDRTSADQLRELLDT